MNETFASSFFLEHESRFPMNALFALPERFARKFLTKKWLTKSLFWQQNASFLAMPPEDASFRLILLKCVVSQL